MVDDYTEKRQSAIHTFRSPIMEFLDRCQPILDSGNKLSMETINTFIQAPSDKKQAAWEAELASPVIFTDGSARKNFTGIGVAWKIEQSLRREREKPRLEISN
jgi:hypothetical protein